MSGHSKWATTKRHKAAIDAKKGKIFSAISKDLTMAAKDGGGDPSTNARLRMLIQKAKAANLPADNVDRAIKKGTGELPGVVYEQLLYEGYGPGGIGIIVEVTTDNKNRAAGEVRSTFTKNGGNLAAPGALQFNFTKLGQFVVDAEKSTEEAIMDAVLDAGADDIRNEGDCFEILCPVQAFSAVGEALEKAGIETEDSELAWIPNSTTEVTDPELARKIMKLIDSLEDLEDVQNVYSNSDFDGALLD